MTAMTTKYYPRKPVKSFRDLEVYQELHDLGVIVVKKYCIGVKDDFGISAKLVDCILEIPVKIARAHSMRFANSASAIDILEEVLTGCNLAVVYLEQYRDVVRKKEVDEDAIREKVLDIEGKILEYLRLRGKVLRLQKSWQKFAAQAD